jgi:hypothetical protein
MKKSSVFEWYKPLRKDREKVEDETRSQITDENSENERNLVHSDV